MTLDAELAGRAELTLAACAGVTPDELVRFGGQVATHEGFRRVRRGLYERVG